MKIFLSYLLGLAGMLAGSALFAADEPVTPGSGFNGDRYAGLWTKSPFAIATPEAAATSTDYDLVGIAQFDGVTYASLIEKQSREHFVLASDKPVRDLTLVSVNHGKVGGESSAVVSRHGEMLTLKLTDAPAPGTPMAPPPMAMPMPMPSMGNSSVGGMPAQPPLLRRPPRARMHQPLINTPPPPNQ